VAACTKAIIVPVVGGGNTRFFFYLAWEGLPLTLWVYWTRWRAERGIFV